ncbi:alpha/beta fold hydrolase [Glaciibacter superstes]|uniref:alpha/beta fold hydrolase n=1 Tax=Glaciibacter superstes TaxID=501023 RepID=UPI0003B3D5D0|nr:alpha/beta hydrolase [Glaciibacter superstes]
MNAFTLRRFEQGDLAMVVRTYGAAEWSNRDDDQPLSFVLVHGIGASSRYYEPLAGRLRKYGIVHLVELPGFGASPEPEHPLGIEAFARLVIGMCDAWNIPNRVIVGHSMGAQVATEFAVRAPEQVVSVVLVGPVVDPSAPTAFGQALRLLRDVLAEPPRANWIVASDYLRCGPRWYLAQLPAMLEYRIEERLLRVLPATLVIRGADDPVAPSDWVRHLAQLAPHGRALEVPGSSHVVHFDACDLVADAIASHAAEARSDRARGPEW